MCMLSFRKKIHSDANDDDHTQRTGAKKPKQAKGKGKSLPEPPPPVCLPPPTEPVSSTAVSESLSTEAVTVVACPVTPTTSSAASSAAVAQVPVLSAGLPIYQPPPPAIISSTPFQARTVVSSPAANAILSAPSTSTSTLRVRWPRLSV